MRRWRESVVESLWVWNQWAAAQAASGEAWECSSVVRIWAQNAAATAFRTWRGNCSMLSKLIRLEQQVSRKQPSASSKAAKGRAPGQRVSRPAGSKPLALWLAEDAEAGVTRLSTCLIRAHGLARG